MGEKAKSQIAGKEKGLGGGWLHAAQEQDTEREPTKNEFAFRVWIKLTVCHVD